MLDRANRVTRPVDFRSAVRRGRRVVTPSFTLHVLQRSSVHSAIPGGDGVELDPTRFGFIVTKAVGGAVVRNKVRRRLRAVSRELLPSLGDGRDIVMRALPGSDKLEWATLHAEIAGALSRTVSRG